MFAISSTSKGDKDTAANIKAHKGFTVNLISEPWAVAANFSSIDAPPHISEWKLSGLTMEPSVNENIPSLNLF